MSPEGAGTTAVPSAGGRGRWMPVLFAGVWLVYLGSPLSSVLEHPAGAERSLALVALVCFAGTYLALIARTRRNRHHLLFIADRTFVLMLVLLLLLVAAIAPAAGASALDGLVYVSAAAMMGFPVATAWAVVAGLLVLSEGAAVLVPGWDDGVGSGFGVLLAGVAVFGLRLAMERNRQLFLAREDLARMAVTEERTRFARDLHDILGHSLTVVTVKAELAGRLVATDPDRATREIEDVERLSRQALADVRAAVAGYRDVTLATELASARSALAAAGIEADLPTAVDDVPSDRRALFGWAVREGVTNVVRHSGAQRCTVRVAPGQIEVVDDGRGPVGAPLDDGTSAGARPSGHGLVGLRERAAMAGGRVSVGRAGPWGGFKLQVVVPEAGP